ncbi:MAG: ABC transporter ATP-binding protein, partial [Acidobacteria bacterium]|nr:ABC transporter ATP-binding protein [Acidobacteriota bacterium]
MNPLLEIRGLHKTYEGGKSAGRRPVYAVRGVDLAIQPAETLGVVGESGCGKSTLARCAAWLLKPTEGTVLYDGEDLGLISRTALRLRRRQFQIIFQDAAASLNPRMKVADILVEPFRAHGIGTQQERRSWISELMKRVSLDPAFADVLPESLSGGEQQRVVIARALALKPRLIIADEPVSALDLSVQAQILNLL